jgi:hypothetical protein
LLKEDSLSKGTFRLLDVNSKLVLPIGTVVQALITAMDVIHSFAIPSLFIKTDACPGRINEVLAVIKRSGIFYGQCSELCGVQHSFMPICLNAVTPNLFFGIAAEFFKIINESAEISTLDFFLKKYPLFVNLLLESIDGTYIGTINNVVASPVKEEKKKPNLARYFANPSTRKVKPTTPTTTDIVNFDQVLRKEEQS